MTTNAVRHSLPAMLYRFAAFLQARGVQIRAAARRFDRRLEGRRLAAEAQRALSSMSERELRDIGLDRGDVEQVVSGGSPRAVDEYPPRL